MVEVAVIAVGTAPAVQTGCVHCRISAAKLSEDLHSSPCTDQGSAVLSAGSSQPRVTTAGAAGAGACGKAGGVGIRDGGGVNALPPPLLLLLLLPLICAAAGAAGAGAAAAAAANAAAAPYLGELRVSVELLRLRCLKRRLQAPGTPGCAGWPPVTLCDVHAHAPGGGLSRPPMSGNLTRGVAASSGRGRVLTWLSTGLSAVGRRQQALWLLVSGPLWNAQQLPGQQEGALASVGLSSSCGWGGGWGSQSWMGRRRKWEKTMVAAGSASDRRVPRA
eukprot:79615-Chlamydomonas_euryale.AAC.2